jgi:ubiquinone/menaquinone biosynthesis C-methylase UbiE
MADPTRQYGQQPQMEHPTMAGTLTAQAEMIWPLERPLLERLGLPACRDVLDVGTGTGEIAGRIARAWPDLGVTGVDLFEGHLEAARKAHPPERVPNLVFLRGDARSLPWPEPLFGAVLVRHILHALPDSDRVIREARRVLRPEGLLYVLAEDYAGVLVDTDDRVARDLYLAAAPGMLEQGTDLLHGRSVYRRLRAAGFEDVRVDPIVVDVTSAQRPTFARMLRFWRDGYAGHLATALRVPTAEVMRRFDAQILTVLDTDRYVGWWLLAVSGRK